MKPDLTQLVLLCEFFGPLADGDGRFFMLKSMCQALIVQRPHYDLFTLK